MVSSMKKIAHPSAVDGPVVSEGGRSPSTLTTGQAPSLPASAPAPVPAAKVGPLAPGQRWSVAR
jgi:transposase